MLEQENGVEKHLKNLQKKGAFSEGTNFGHHRFEAVIAVRITDIYK